VKSRRWAALAACWAVTGGAAALLAQSVSSSGDSLRAGLTAASSESDEGLSSAHPRLREGMRLNDAPGYFEAAADVPVFIDEEGRRLIGLENLNLQRIVQSVRSAEDPKSLKWKVTGTITEYEGRNYILVERAVYSPSRR
jgi:hypothetical protein